MVNLLKNKKHAQCPVCRRYFSSDKTFERHQLKKKIGNEYWTGVTFDRCMTDDEMLSLNWRYDNGLWRPEFLDKALVFG